MIQSCNYESNTFEEIKLQLWYVKIQLWSVKSQLVVSSFFLLRQKLACIFNPKFPIYF